MTELSKKVKDKMLRSRLSKWVITGNDLCYMEDKPVPEWTKSLKTRIMEAFIIYGDKIRKELK